MATILATLSPEKIRAIEALLSGQTNDQAAKYASVSIRTLFKWKADEIFKQALQDAEKQALGEITRRLTSAGLKAVDVLSEIANDTAEKSSVRVQAAGKILESVVRLTELSEIRQRMEKLEAALGELERVA